MGLGFRWYGLLLLRCSEGRPVMLTLTTEPRYLKTTGALFLVVRTTSAHVTLSGHRLDCAQLQSRLRSAKSTGIQVNTSFEAGFSYSTRCCGNFASKAPSKLPGFVLSMRLQVLIAAFYYPHPPNRRDSRPLVVVYQHFLFPLSLKCSI